MPAIAFYNKIVIGELHNILLACLLGIKLVIAHIYHFHSFLASGKIENENERLNSCR